MNLYPKIAEGCISKWHQISAVTLHHYPDVAGTKIQNNLSPKNMIIRPTIRGIPKLKISQKEALKLNYPGIVWMVYYMAFLLQDFQ